MFHTQETLAAEYEVRRRYRVVGESPDGHRVVLSTGRLWNGKLAWQREGCEAVVFGGLDEARMAVEDSGPVGGNPYPVVASVRLEEVDG